MHDQRLVLEELYPGSRGENNTMATNPTLLRGVQIRTPGHLPKEPGWSLSGYPNGSALSPQPLDSPHGKLDSNVLPVLPRWREESQPTTIIVRAYLREDGIPSRLSRKPQSVGFRFQTPLQYAISDRCMIRRSRLKSCAPGQRDRITTRIPVTTIPMVSSSSNWHSRPFIRPRNVSPKLASSTFTWMTISSVSIVLVTCTQLSFGYTFSVLCLCASAGPRDRHLLHNGPCQDGLHGPSRPRWCPKR